MQGNGSDLNGNEKNRIAEAELGSEPDGYGKAKKRSEMAQNGRGLRGDAPEEQGEEMQRRGGAKISIGKAERGKALAEQGEDQQRQSPAVLGMARERPRKEWQWNGQETQCVGNAWAVHG